MVFMLLWVARKFAVTKILSYINIYMTWRMYFRNHSVLAGGNLKNFFWPIVLKQIWRKICKTSKLWLLKFLQSCIQDQYHCVKNSKCGVFSGPYFNVIGLNTEIYSVNFRIQSENGKKKGAGKTVIHQFSCTVNFREKSTVADFFQWQ